MSMTKIPINLPPLTNSIAEDIASVQPLSNGVGSIFHVQHVSEAHYPFGEAIHDFVKGWGVGDGEQWIDFISFIDQYGSDAIIPESQRRRMKNWYQNEKDSN